MSGLAGWSLLAIATLAAMAAAVELLGCRRWAQRTRRLLAGLEAARLPVTPTHYDAARELEGLPAPVQRHFRAVLSDGQPMVAAASIEHRGTFNLGETGDRWKPFSSRQRVVMRRPGFVWDGTVALLPGLAVRVHDAYVGGEGILHPTVAGLWPLADLRDAGQLAQDELMRFLAEAAWYPTALLPSQGVRWAPLDEHSARATIVDGAISATLDFDFADDGTVCGVRAAARGRSLAGSTVMTPWEGRWSGVQSCAGMRVPMRGEIAWLTAQGRKPYWRGTVTLLRHEFVEQRYSPCDPPGRPEGDYRSPQHEGTPVSPRVHPRASEPTLRWRKIRARRAT